MKPRESEQAKTEVLDKGSAPCTTQRPNASSETQDHRIQAYVRAVTYVKYERYHPHIPRLLSTSSFTCIATTETPGTSGANSDWAQPTNQHWNC